MIYIYFRFRRAEEEARLAAQRSEEQQRQAEKRRQLQASNKSDHFQPNLGHRFFFFGRFCYVNIWITMENLMSLFFKSQPTTSPCLVVFQQINESSSSWSVSKSFWISRRWRWRLANLPQRRPFGHVFSLFAYRGISQMFPEAKKERESREKAKAFLAAEGQGLRFDLKGRTNLVCSSMACSMHSCSTYPWGYRHVRAAHKWCPVAILALNLHLHLHLFEIKRAPRWQPIPCTELCSVIMQAWWGTGISFWSACGHMLHEIPWDSMICWRSGCFCGWEPTLQSRILLGTLATWLDVSMEWIQWCLRQSPLGLAKWLNRRDSHAEAHMWWLVVLRVYRWRIVIDAFADIDTDYIRLRGNYVLSLNTCQCDI